MNELNQNYNLKGFEKWLNADENRKKDLDSWDSFLEIWLKEMFEKYPKLTKRNIDIWKIFMRCAGHTTAKEYAKVFLEWLEKQKQEKGI